MSQTRKIPPKPARPEPTEAQIDSFISRAPDARPAPAPTAAAPAPAPAIPPKLRKAKAPFTLTLDPGIVAEVDEMAPHVGLSRSSATNLALRRWLDDEYSKKQTR